MLLFKDVTSIKYAVLTHYHIKVCNSYDVHCIAN